MVFKLKDANHFRQKDRESIKGCIHLPECTQNFSVKRPYQNVSFFVVVYTHFINFII